MKKAKATIDSLPQEIVEEILLQLPLFDVYKARLVCKKWRQVTGTTSFQQSYTGTCTLIEDHRDYLPPGDMRLYQIVDSSNNSRNMDRTWALGNGLVLSLFPLAGAEVVPNSSHALDDYHKRLYFGNVITNKWNEVAGSLDLDDQIVSLALGDGKYRLVSWNREGTLSTCDKRRDWAVVRNLDPHDNEDQDRCTNPVVINNTVFCLDYKDMILMEYGIDGRIISREMKIDQAESGRLVVWKGELYILLICGDSEHQVLQLWAVSADKGSSTLVNQCKMKIYMADLLHVSAEKNVLHCYGIGDDSDSLEILYDMEKKTLADNFVHTPHKAFARKPIF